MITLEAGIFEVQPLLWQEVGCGLHLKYITLICNENSNTCSLTVLMILVTEYTNCLILVLMEIVPNLVGNEVLSRVAQLGRSIDLLSLWVDWNWFLDWLIFGNQQLTLKAQHCQCCCAFKVSVTHTVCDGLILYHALFLYIYERFYHWLKSSYLCPTQCQTAHSDQFSPPCE